MHLLIRITVNVTTCKFRRLVPLTLREGNSRVFYLLSTPRRFSWAFLSFYRIFYHRRNAYNWISSFKANIHAWIIVVGVIAWDVCTLLVTRCNFPTISVVQKVIMVVVVWVHDEDFVWFQNCRLFALNRSLQVATVFWRMLVSLCFYIWSIDITTLPYRYNMLNPLLVISASWLRLTFIVEKLCWLTDTTMCTHVF